MEYKKRVARIELGADVFMIPEQYLGSRHSFGVAKDGINITLLLPNYQGMFANDGEYELVPDKIDVMWNIRGQRFGSDAKEQLANAIEFMNIQFVEEYSNVKVYKNRLFNKDYYFFTLPEDNSVIVVCSTDTPIKMCRAFYYQEQLETGVFFSFRDIHLDKVEEIYTHVNALIFDWRQ